MKKSVLYLGALLLVLSASAEEVDPMTVCDNTYSVCTEKCDAKENVSADCYNTCDKRYQRCLDVANGYTPEPEKVPKAEKTPKPVVEKKG